MFQTFFKHALLSNGSAGAASQIARCNSNFVNRVRPREIREVKLIGRIHQNPLTLRDGSKLVTVQTYQDDNNYKLHRALIRSKNMLNLIGDNLSVGQRVYLSGVLRATDFVNNKKQMRQIFQINVNELYATKLPNAESNATDDGKPKRQIDENNVSLLAYIASDIQHFENNSRFSLALNSVSRNEEGTENRVTFFFNVLVHDSDLIELLKNKLQKRDKVFINGSLSSRPEMDENGATKNSGFIEATNILKVDKFSETELHDVMN